MKIFTSLIFFITLLMNMAFLYISPKTEINENQFIDTIGLKILDGFLQNGFVIADNNSSKNPYFILNNENSSDISVKIYAKSQLSKVNAIFILVNLNEGTSNKEKNKSKRPLNENYFQNLKKSLYSLKCSNNIDFLRSGFLCKEGNYEIIYTINGDNLDSVRDIFGFNKRSELIINIKPIE